MPPKNVTATLELSGHTISRRLTEPAANGGVIVVNGTLEVTGTGAITGGNPPAQAAAQRDCGVGRCVSPVGARLHAAGAMAF